jgi:endonuclease YncB( thermonuclease family)
MGYDRSTCVRIGVLGLVALAAVGCSAARPAIDKVDVWQTETTTTPAPVARLYVTNQKDGDSFVASDGKEYRLGLVNAPELGEPCGREARQFSREFLAAGFTADTYSSDRYGRTVAEVFDRSGRSLNVALAESGLGNGRYLNQFGYENPGLAHRLEVAFAGAKQPACAKA